VPACGAVMKRIDAVRSRVGVRKGTAPVSAQR
jgi:hypothetical protein